MTQAMGMGPSTYLAPSVRRFFLAEPAIWLLCSDGLSDYDLVEAAAEETARSLLEGRVTLTAAAQHLIHLAETRNGHDNATVALVQVIPPPEPPRSPETLIQPPAFADSTPPAAAPSPTRLESIAAAHPPLGTPATPVVDRSPSAPATATPPPDWRDSPPRQPWGYWLLGGAIAVLSMAAGVALVPWLRQMLEINRGPSPAPTATALPQASPDLSSPAPGQDETQVSQGASQDETLSPPAGNAWQPETIIRWSDPNNLQLYDQTHQIPRAAIAPNSVLKILNLPSKDPAWQAVQLCSAGSPLPLATSPAAKANEKGWVRQDELRQGGRVLPQETAQAGQLNPLGSCAPAALSLPSGQPPSPGPGISNPLPPAEQPPATSSGAPPSTPNLNNP